MEKQTLLPLLGNPTAEYRGKPFWAWNGKLEKQELLRQIEVLHEMGFGGFFIHSRTGLETEYLGKEWFELVRACAEKAQSLGMETWLYDEDRWPSGVCGGEVTRERKNRLRFVSLYESEEAAFACEEVAGILCRYAVKTETDESGEERLIDYYSVSSVSEVKAGYRYGVFAEEEQACESFYNGFAYINTMDRAVTELFLKSTHEKYAKYCGDLFGTVIKGIFTDEPHRGALFNGFSLKNANKSRMAPYTASLTEAYERKFGTKLEFPELYWRKKEESFNQTACNYIDIVDDLFTQNFAKPCQKWCRAHGLKLTGHILHEDNLSIQTSLSGSCMRYYEYMDYPGIDVLGENTNIYWAAKQCSSVARQLGKKYVLSELYGCTGWDMTLDRYKKLGDWNALFGVNLRCPHLSWYTMKGEAKRDYPASILHQNAWYADWKYVEDYFARLAVLSAEGNRICETLVLTPMREMWGKVRMGWMDIFTPNDQDISQLDKQYISDFTRLTARGIDFDYGDEEILRKYGKVVTEYGKTYLQVGEVRYSEVLWECGGRISDEVRRLLNSFVRSGGHLTERIEELSPSFRLDVPHGVAYAAYELGEDVWIFLLNLDKENGTNGQISLPERLLGFNAEKWNFRTGKRMGQIDIRENGSFDVSLTGGEEYILRLTKDRIEKTVSEDYPVLDLPEEFAYELTEPNVLPLDYATWEINGMLQNDGKEEDVLLIDRAIRQKCGKKLRGGEMLQPWFVEKYLSGGKEEKLCKLKLTFIFETEQIPEKAWLAKEDGELDCFVNGDLLGAASEKYWADKCFKLYPVTLKKGCNEIVLQGNFFESEGLEAVYLLGDFGVKAERTLTALPEKLKTGDISVQGLPYYTGGIKYHTGITEGKYTIVFERLGGSVMRVHGGEKSEVLAFAPYRTQVTLQEELVLELIFSRRNTFGPLHLVYPQDSCSPAHFVLTGEARTSEFVPIPQGLYKD